MQDRSAIYSDGGTTHNGLSLFDVSTVTSIVASSRSTGGVTSVPGTVGQRYSERLHPDEPRDGLEDNRKPAAKANRPNSSESRGQVKNQRTINQRATSPDNGTAGGNVWTVGINQYMTYGPSMSGGDIHDHMFNIPLPTTNGSPPREFGSPVVFSHANTHSSAPPLPPPLFNFDDAWIAAHHPGDAEMADKLQFEEYAFVEDAGGEKSGDFTMAAILQAGENAAAAEANAEEGKDSMVRFCHVSLSLLYNLAINFPHHVKRCPVVQNPSRRCDEDDKRSDE